MDSCVQKIGYPVIVETIKNSTDKCVGEILTIIESVLPEGKSCNATKLLCKQAIWRNYSSTVEGLTRMLEEK